jgi:molybdopterin-guanine dinucleotide biosynthesis protein A
MSTRRRCTGAVLAGGRSSRFGGQPKGLAQVGGRRMLDRVALALGEASDRIVLVANDPAAASWLPGTGVVRDLRPGGGALSGLHAALASAGGDDVLVCAWDSPFVPGSLLMALRDAGTLDDADAAVPASHAPWGFEPLVAWYAPSCLPAIERALDSGVVHAGGWQGTVRTLRLDASPWGDPAHRFFNVNSAEDLVEAEQLCATECPS